MWLCVDGLEADVRDQRPSEPDYSQTPCENLPDVRIDDE